MLEKLGDDATVFVKNEKSQRAYRHCESQRSRYQEHEPGGTQTEIDNSIPTSPQSVNKQYSVSERTPEQKKEILAQARRYASGEIGKDEFFRHVKQRIYSLKNV